MKTELGWKSKWKSVEMYFRIQDCVTPVRHRVLLINVAFSLPSQTK